MSSDERLSNSTLHRRSFLRALGAAFGTAVLPEMVSSCASDGSETVGVNGMEALTVASAINVVRPQDMLVLTIGFVNLKHNAVTGMLAKLSPALPSQIILDFPPQAVLEDAVGISATGTDATKDQLAGYTNAGSGGTLASAMLGGPSRLIFQLPDAYAPVPYSLSSILALCGSSSLVLTPTMQNTLATVAPPAASNPPSGDPLIDRILATALAPIDPAAAARAAAFAGQPPPAGLATFPGTQVTGAGSTKPQGLSDNSVTQIEIPYRVKLSPTSQAGWSHATTPVQGSTQAYEVWHTSLGVRSVPANVAGTVDERNASLRTARALWTRDWDLTGVRDTVPIENPSLTADYRGNIVLNSSAAGPTTASPQGANPIQVNRLMLSALGGYLDARGDWPNTTNDVARWIHRMVGGRDTFVEVDTPGYLLPFGHSATSLTITRRNDNPQLGPVGELYSFNLILIGNPVTSYRSAGLQTATQLDLLRWPFLTIELKKTHFITQRANGGTYWPTDASGTPIMVDAVGRDRRGRAIHFSVPLYFVASGQTVSTALASYRAAIAAAPPIAPPRSLALPPVGNVPTDASNPYRSNASLNVPMAGQRIAYADSKTAASSAAPPKDDTTFATQSLSFDVVNVSDSFQQPITKTPQFAPVLTSATIYVEALHQYLPAQPDGSMPPVDVWYHSQFLSAPAFDPVNNKSQLLFKLANPVTADFTRDPSGADRSDCGTGFIAPNMTFNALSRTTGPAYDGTVPPTTATGHAPMIRPLGVTPMGNPLPSFMDGAFDPSTYLGMAESALDNIKVFGVFSILDIIKMVLPSEALSDLNGLVNSAEEAALKYAPKFIAEGLSELEKIVSLIAQVKSQVELLYTNAQELVGPNYSGGIPTGVLGSATSLVVGQVQSTAQNLQQQATAIAQQVQTVITAAQKFYGTSPTAGLQATITAIENLDLTTLAGQASTPGAILELIANAQGLLTAVTAVANYAARGTIAAQPIAVNGSNLDAASQVIGSVGQTTNAALQIASGVAQSFSTKLQQLMDALGVVNGVAPEVEAILSSFSTLFQAAEQALDAVRDMTVKIEWQPKVGSFALDGWTIFRPATQHALTLLLEARAKATDTQSAGVDVSCRLDHFDLCIGQTSNGNGGSTGVVSLQFDHIAFQMLAGKKPDVDVKINGLAFGGPLAFVETLMKLIPMDGFSDPPFLDVTSDGIKAGFTLAIPNIAIGVFSLENLAIKAELDIPFFSSGSAGAALTFTFSFCDKDHPFIITVSLLGGGGYFVVSFTPKGLEHLEASICVGAQLALNLFDIAQGSVSIMAGITFTIDDTSGTQDVSLTAFLRLHGELDVLGIVTISVVLSVSMTYDFTNKLIVAEAEVKVDVSILFFSVHVDLPFRKEFHSCNNDPTLYQLMPPVDQNQQYGRRLLGRLLQRLRLIGTNLPGA